MVRKTKGKIEKLMEQLSFPSPTVQKVKQPQKVSAAKTLCQSFDTGNPIQLSFPKELKTAQAESFSLDSADVVSGFGSMQESRIHSERDQLSGYKKTSVRTENNPTQKLKPEEKQTDFVEYEEKLDKEIFEDDLNDIIQEGLKKEPEQKAKPSTTPQQNNSEEELSIFDKMEKAQSMTYDLGTAQLSSAFQGFDDQLDLEEIGREENKIKNATTQQSIFEETDHIEDVEHEVIDEENRKAEEKLVKAQSIPNIGGTLFNLRGEAIGESEEKGEEAIIVIDRKLARKLKKEKIRASKNSTSPDTVKLSSLDSEDYFVLPPYDHRQEIKAIMENDDTKSFSEYGGRGLVPVDTEGNILYNQMKHFRSEDGEPAGPNDEAALIYITKLHEREIEAIKNGGTSYGSYITDYTWHSHPGGSWVFDSENNKWLTLDEYTQKENQKAIGSTTINFEQSRKSFDFGPSIQDIKFVRNFDNTEKISDRINLKEMPELRDNFVIHKREGKVFYFTNETTVEKGEHEAKIKLEDFYTLNGTKQ